MKIVLPADDETLDESPGRIAISERRRRERRSSLELSLGLYRELMQAHQEDREALLGEERFHSLDLLDHLLHESECRQLSDAPLAQSLAALARQLASLLCSHGTEAKAAASRALCLEANALRLRKELERASQRVSAAVPFLETDIERAYFCRTAGLLRWEQGRLDEADALLVRALRLYIGEGLQEEMAICNGLLGLLREEEPALGDPYSNLKRAWVSLSPEIHPGMLVRVGLALAANQAERGKRLDAKLTLGSTWGLFGDIEDELEVSWLYWAEARALGLIGEPQVASQTLQALRTRLLNNGLIGDSILASVDLMIVLAEQSDTEAILSLTEDLQGGAREEAVILLSVGILDELGETLENGPADARKLGRKIKSAIRRIFRARGIPLRPLPFA